jgi:predicted MPP superfamily phosphohydrolase
MSDLHIESMDDVPPVEDFVTPCEDILILAGDIGRIHKFNQLRQFIKNLCDKFKTVIYILGNHEYYYVEGVEFKTMDSLLEDLEKIKKENSNLHVLNREHIIIDDVCFTGVTLWSQTSLEIPTGIVKIKNINKYNYNFMHKKDVGYIEKMVKHCEVNKLKLVVISHHCPTYDLILHKQGYKYKSLYATNLDYLVDKADVWIFGHSHRNFDYYTDQNTRIVSNQKGKHKDKITSFSKTKIIEI